jgi:hypothetical protein
VFELDKQTWCEFVPLMRPSDLSEKKIRSVSNSNNSQLVADRVQQIGADYPELFTHLTRSYASKNYVGNTCINVGIAPYQSGINRFAITLYHRGKYNSNADFEQSFTELCEENGVEPVFQKDKAYVCKFTDGRKIEDVADAVKFFKLFVSAIEDKILKCNNG